MAFLIVYSFLLLGIVMCTIELKSRQLLHTTYKIYVISVVFQLFGILFLSSCYLKLAVNGLFVSKIRRCGNRIFCYMYTFISIAKILLQVTFLRELLRQHSFCYCYFLQKVIPSQEVVCQCLRVLS